MDTKEGLEHQLWYLELKIGVDFQYVGHFAGRIGPDTGSQKIRNAFLVIFVLSILSHLPYGMQNNVGHIRHDVFYEFDSLYQVIKA